MVDMEVAVVVVEEVEVMVADVADVKAVMDDGGSSQWWLRW